jgi:hypothetical protein
MTKIKPHVDALMELTPTGECPLGYDVPASFQCCMMSIFSDMIEQTWKYSWTSSQFMERPSRNALKILIKFLNGVPRRILFSIGKMPFHGKRRDYSRTQGVRTRDRGG